MRPPSLPLLTAFLLCDVCLSQQLPVEHGFNMLSTLIRKQAFAAWDLNGKSNELKLSPVPPSEAEVGLLSPPVPKPLGTEYEVHEAPATPHNNFILQPVGQGTISSGAYPFSPNGKPQVYGSNNHYFINQQGNLVQRPQRPQYGLGQVSSRPPPLNFNESPPPFPHLTDEELYMLGQPVPLHQIYQGNGTSAPEIVEEEASMSSPSGVGLAAAHSNVTVGFTASIISQSTNISSHTTASTSAMLPQSPASNQPPKSPNQPPMSPNRHPIVQYLPLIQPIHPNPVPPNQPSTDQKLPTSQPPTLSNQPSMTQSRPVGEYIATVSYGPSNPSLVYTCIPTEQLKPSLVGYVQGPLGYACKMSIGRPSLANQILTANNQKPVTHPVVSMQPVSLPIVTPIKFVDAVQKDVK